MRYFIIIALLLPLFVGCEQTVDADWPDHEEKLVVTGYLQFRGDSVLTYVRVNRTLPLSEPYDDSRAIVNDASVQLRSGDNTVDIPQDGKFYPFSYDFNYSGVFLRSDETTFSLLVRHENKTARADLDVADLDLRFESITAKPLQWSPEYLEVNWSMRLPDRRADATCYFETWDPATREWREVYRIELRDYGTRDGDLLRGTITVWAGYSSRPRLRYILVAQSGTYQDYLNARWSWNNSGSPFEPDAKNPPFNVRGDAIGFFWYEFRGDPVEIVY
jgi:hypothetical protein